MSADSLKGQLGLKSGPLAPTSAKWTTQMLVISHMKNHYNKIGKAKAAIDNRPPKSLLSSQKMRDQRNRKLIEKYDSRPSSRLSSCMTQRTDTMEEDIFNEDQWDEPEDDEERKVFDIMRMTLYGPLKAQHGIFNTDPTAADASNSKEDHHPGFGMKVAQPRSNSLNRVAEVLRGGGTRMGQTRPLSARSTTSLASNISQTSRTTSKATYDGDVLDKHAHSFTQPDKPFTPRTLKSNHQSSLKQYKYYTPPPKKTSRSKDDVAEEKQEDAPLPQAKPRRSKVMHDLDKSQILTETMLMDMSLQSHNPGWAGQGGNSGVPPLDITMDKDHLSWVQDQAARARGAEDGVVV